jgi:Ca2+-binding EF-hand superfamily protein
MISNNYCFNYNNNNFEESNGYDYNKNINGINNNYIKNDNIPNSKKDINGNQYYFEYQSEPMNFTKNTLDNNYFNKIETPIYNKKTNLFIDNNQFCELCKILYEIIDSEKNIEFLKNKLFSDNNFNLNKLFNYFDKYQNGYISLVDFQEGLESFDINNKNYLLLFSNFDLSNNGRLTKENFISIFLRLNLSECIRNNNNILVPGEDMDDYTSFEYNTKEIITQLLNCLINHFTYLNEISKYYEDKIIDIEYIFDVLDKYNKGYIEEEEFQQIFKYGDNGKCIPFEDLLLIMEKIDSDKDGKITLQDFIQLFKK